MAAAEFERLRKERNKLLHVQPASTADGAQRLIHDGVAWEVETIDDAADAFTECNGRFVALWGKLRFHALPFGKKTTAILLGGNRSTRALHWKGAGYCARGRGRAGYR